MRVLIIEDDENIRENLKLTLNDNGFEVEYAILKNEILNKLKNENVYDLFLVDVMLPDCNGFTVCSDIRKKSKQPIIFLTCCDDEDSITRGLDLGADDYMVKPFRSAELMSRVRAIFRRARQKNQTQTRCYEGLTINLKDRIIIRQGSQFKLTPIEYQLLERLMNNSGQIVKRESFLINMWDDYGNYVENNTLTVAVSRLKNKLGRDSRTGKPYIENVYGVGYRWIGGDSI